MRKKEQNRTEQSFEELLGLPLEIPISYKDLMLGNLKIDYKADKSLKPSSEKGRVKGLLNLIVYAELIRLSKFLKEDIELAIKFDEGKRDKMKRFASLLNLFYSSTGSQYNQSLYYLLKDDEVFELIKSEGPISLRNSMTQVMMRIWLSDEIIAERKINKLRKSLLMYALGSEDKPSIIGRPEIEIIKTLGTDWIKVMYQDIRSILKIARKNKECYPHVEINELIKQASRTFLLSLEKKLKKSPDSRELKEKIGRLKKGFKIYKDMKYRNPISECIENNKDLKSKFYELEWAPYDMSIRVVARLLDTSYQKIKDILYRRQK